jgi:hypothetical protein
VRVSETQSGTQDEDYQEPVEQVIITQERGARSGVR